MAIKGNKGEWSEFYAFIKILTDKNIFAADENLDVLQDKFFNVLKIIREEARFGRKTYDIAANKDEIVILGENNDVIGTARVDIIKNGVKKIFAKMKEGGSTSAFAITAAGPLMKKLKCSQIKASCGNKADLILVVHDRISPTFPELGFSIKSMLGSPATLLNPSGATNFTYKLKNLNDSKVKEVQNVSGHSKLRDRSNIIYGADAKMEFVGLDNEHFKRNLSMIDVILPEILAEILKIYYHGGGIRTLPELVEALGKDKTLYDKYGLDQEMCEYKIKNFLVAIALGMTPNRDWDGFTKAHGGYIVVKEDGELVCYHLYNRDEFQNYLYKNTKLDTPSTTRYNFGNIFFEGGNKYIKLNLQIRFIK